MLAVVVFGAAAAACRGSNGTQTVQVELGEWFVRASTATVKAGKVTFEARNLGPEDPHELVIVRTDLPADQLPMSEEGGIDEDKVEVVDEIEPFGLNETGAVSLSLPKGKYVLLCNIVETEDGERESHYAKGMYLAFTVE